MAYSNYVKNVLLDLINEMNSDPTPYVKNPQKNFTRKRKLDFGMVMKTIISLGSSSLKNELFQNYDTTSITASAFVQQREKIKFTAFETLLKNFNKSFYGEKLYRGYRLIGVDGSSLSIHPDPTDADNYRQDRPEIKGFSHMHLNAFYDLLNKRYVDAFIQPGNKSNERYAKKEMVLRYDSQDKTIFIGDRGYENYNNFMHISKKRKNYLVRVKDRNSNGILSGLILPDEEEFDIDIDIILTRRNTNNVKQNPHIYKFMPQHQIFDFMDENKECNIQFRIVRIKLSEDNYEAIITNLDRNEFPAEDIRYLYNVRWGIETSFRHLKYVVGLNNFHSKKVDSIKQEVFAMLIMHNFCEIIAGKADIKQKKTKHRYQLNFTHAFRVCREFFRLPDWIDPPDVEKLLLREVLPIRPNRSYNRNVKKHKVSTSFNYRLT